MISVPLCDLSGLCGECFLEQFHHRDRRESSQRHREKPFSDRLLQPVLAEPMLFITGLKPGVNKRTARGFITGVDRSGMAMIVGPGHASRKILLTLPPSILMMNYSVK